MSTIFKTSGRTLMIENLTHAQTYPDVTLLYPAGFYVLRVTGEEAKTVNERMRAAGFVGDENTLINPHRLVMAEDAGATARLMLDGAAKHIVVPIEFLAYLEPKPEAPAVSSAGKSGLGSSERKKKGSE